MGEHLAKLLKSRVAYHHSGLSYAARAGVIEPLAKAGQLRVVVATMGLAAGINFSLRSVALAAESYRREEVEQPLRPDEILQMFGRAGRRGLDETGFVLITANELRLLDARPGHLSRSGAVDWSALLGLMAAAARQGRDPFAEAVRVQERLFTTKPIVPRGRGIPEASRTSPADSKPMPSARAMSAGCSAKCSTAAANGKPSAPAMQKPLGEIRICSPQAAGGGPGAGSGPRRATLCPAPAESRMARPALPCPDGEPLDSHRAGGAGESRLRRAVRVARKRRGQDLRAGHHRCRQAGRRSRDDRQVDPPLDELEWPAGAAVGMGGADRPAGGAEAGGAKDTGGSISERGTRIWPRSASPD